MNQVFLPDSTSSKHARRWQHMLQLAWLHDSKHRLLERRVWCIRPGDGSGDKDKEAGGGLDWKCIGTILYIILYLKAKWIHYLVFFPILKSWLVGIYISYCHFQKGGEGCKGSIDFNWDINDWLKCRCRTISMNNLLHKYLPKVWHSATYRVGKFSKCLFPFLNRSYCLRKFVPGQLLLHQPLRVLFLLLILFS